MVWTAKYPRVIGVLVIVFSLWMGIETGKATSVYRQFSADATLLTATVTSLGKVSSAPPRWHATVQWHEGCPTPPCQAVITIGPRSLKHAPNEPEFTMGQGIRLLVNSSDPTKVMLYSEALDPSSSFWNKSASGPLAVVFTLIGVIIVLFPDFIRRRIVYELDKAGVDAGVPAENVQADAGSIRQTEEQVMKQRTESFARLEAAERAADRAHDSNAKLLGLISTTLSDVESRGTVAADVIAPLRAECDALQAESPAPFREALAEPYEQFEQFARDERIARDNAAQEALARRLLEQHAAYAAVGRAWRKRAEQLNYQASNLSLPKRQTPRA